VSPVSIESAIAHDLGPGSDLNAVRSFMDGHHIVYAGYSKQFRTAYGKIYWSSVSLYMKGHIYMEFTFNEEGKLASHRVVELYEFLWE